MSDHTRPQHRGHLPPVSRPRRWARKPTHLGRFFCAVLLLTDVAEAFDVATETLLVRRYTQTPSGQAIPRGDGID